MKSNGHLTFRYVIDYWSKRSDEGIPGAILSYNVVDSVVIQKNKHIEAHIIVRLQECANIGFLHVNFT